MSAAVAYDPALLAVQFLSGSVWSTLPAATVTLAAGYDVAESGVLLIGPSTCTVSMAWKDNTTTDPLVLGRRVRVAYDGTELFSGLVADLTHTFTAHPPRTDLSASLVSRTGEALATPKTWKALPYEAASVRLERFITTVDLNGAADNAVVAEEPGEATLLELIRAFSASIGKPVRMDSATAVSVVDDPLTLPTGYTSTDAATMYASVTHTASAGDRVLSVDPGDEAFSASAVLVTDDVQLLVSDWALPQALPVPFADSALTSRWSVTLTPKHATGSLDFVTATANITRPRPPLAYVPGGATVPLTGGQPYDPGKDYPAGSVVTKDGHLYRAPAPIKKGGNDPGSGVDVEPWDGDVLGAIAVIMSDTGQAWTLSGGITPGTWTFDITGYIAAHGVTYVGTKVYDINAVGTPLVAASPGFGGRLIGPPINIPFEGTAGPVTLSMSMDTTNPAACELVISAYVGASAGTTISLRDTVNGTGGRFTAWASSSKASNGDITVDIEVDPGQAAGKTTSVGLFARSAGVYETRLTQVTWDSDDDTTPLHFTFSPSAIVWDTNGDRTGDLVIPAAFTGLVLRQGDGSTPDDTYVGPVVATYPFGSLIGALQPVWREMIQEGSAVLFWAVFIWLIVLTAYAVVVAARYVVRIQPWPLLVACPILATAMALDRWSG